MAVTWAVEPLKGGVLRVAFTGGGAFSSGHPDGERMSGAIRDILTEYRPNGLIIDLRRFEYRFGDWIAGVPLSALPSVGIGRVCVLAAGKTGKSLGTLWGMSRLDRIVPLFQEQEEAIDFLSSSSNSLDG